MFNEDKLCRELDEQGFTLTRAARAIRIDPATFYNKISGASQFKTNETARIRKLMKLSPERLCEIFFDE